MIRSLYTSVSGMMNSQTRMDLIGNNLANANTVAFKTSTAALATVFEEPARLPSENQPAGLSVGMGNQLLGTIRQFSQGAFQRTDVPTDLAIQGDGFFAIEGPGGDRYVTRAGNFLRDADGYLRTVDGYFLLGVTGDPAVAPDGAGTAGFPPERVQVPAEAAPGEPLASFAIGPDGGLSVVGRNGTTRTVAYVPLQHFTNPNGLIDRGGNRYDVSTAAGDNTFYPARGGVAGAIQAGSLELSNVDMAREFSDMIIVQRGFEAAARTITTSDEMLQTATNLKR